MSDVMLTAIIVGVVVQFVFGTACVTLADEGNTKHPFAWFIVGLCLGPLGLSFSLISRDPYRTGSRGPLLSARGPL